VTHSPSPAATPDDLDLGPELELALELADLADAITLPRFDAKSFSVDWKANRSEVTEADRDAESRIADRLAVARPDHGLFGEEHGLTGAAGSPWRWIVDPIDGTSNFVRGIPVWATLIALVHADAGALVGVISAPSLHRRWHAARGLGAWLGARRLAVSDTARLEDAQVCVTFNDGWDRAGRTASLVQLQQQAYRARGFGDFWQHMLVAEGAVDVAIDVIGLEPYDLAAVQVVVEEAGGTFTDRFGERTFLHDSAVSTNGVLHETVLRYTC
jgi:histidinol-phosphatase